MYKLIILLALSTAHCKSLENGQEILQQVSRVVPGDKLLEISTVEAKTGDRQSRKRVTSINDVLNCGFDVTCLLDTLQTVLDERKHIMLVEADSRYLKSHNSRAQSNESPSELAQTVEGIINQMSDIVKDTVNSWFKQLKLEESGDQPEETAATEDEEQNEKEEGRNDITEEGRGKKKKKLKSLIKLLILGAVLKAKLTVLLQLLSAALQIKFFFIALAGLLINKIRLWYDIKKSHNPQKVIYYEHAQHQHHYDHLEDDHHGGSIWGRAYEVPKDDDIQESAQNMAYRGQKPTSWSAPFH